MLNSQDRLVEQQCPQGEVARDTELLPVTTASALH